MRTGVSLCLLLTACGRISFDDATRDVAHDAPADVALDARVTFQTVVATSSDDAEEFSDGEVYLTSTDLELCDDLGTPELDQVIGIRFVGIPAPRGARVIRATIQFSVEAPLLGTPGMQTLRGQLGPALTFTTTTGDIRARPRTSVGIDWTAPAWDTLGAAGPAQRTPDLSPIIEEILASPQWNDGDALVVFITGSGTNQARAFDSAMPSPPTFELEYEYPSGR